MANLFLSHSSHDKEFVYRLAADLRASGHRPWLDEWEIRVGDCIMSRIDCGIERADYVIVVLSRDSVASGWLDREWKAKYWQEIEDGTTRVLPVLLEDCAVPTLLRTKKYADFRSDYGAGLATLVRGIGSPAVIKALRNTICVVLAKGFSRRWFVPVPVWVFIIVRGDVFDRFKAYATLNDLDPTNGYLSGGKYLTEFGIQEYGTVLEMGAGSPSASTIRKMEYEYGYTVNDSGIIGRDERASRTLTL